ncbi:hypothetical protein [Mumia zhuanghuii]|uniref:Uncharacterized protein n=1 Tax=Mumia zhuanghuii TaxID=2585211 RepID=A0A5C4MAG3_9ACTN|nr:hypothetical protein [Mumia zhuanghuii]TNC32522.1 hypothetical protein FHE65_30350 [Mumia zhuanghuii]
MLRRLRFADYCVQTALELELGFAKGGAPQELTHRLEFLLDQLVLVRRRFRVLLWLARMRNRMRRMVLADARRLRYLKLLE